MKKTVKSLCSFLLCLSLVLGSMMGVLTVSAEDLGADMQAAFTEYVDAVGNAFDPDEMLLCMEELMGLTVTMDTDGYFITHAVGGVYDMATDYPLSIPGHDGYVAAVLTADGVDYAVTASIPHTEENLGVLTTDVYSDDSTVFTTDASGNITNYTGTAQKIVIPGSFDKGILFNNATGKANVQVVMIGAESDSVTTDGLYIGDSCFSAWPNLRAVMLPYIMKSSSIGWRAFFNNPKLKYIRLPSSVQKSGGGYGVLSDGAFMSNPVLENAADKNGEMISAQYRSAIFQATAIRDIIMPTWSQDLNNNSWYNPTYTTGVQTILYQNAGVGSATGYSPSIVMQKGNYTYPRLLVTAMQKAMSLNGVLAVAEVTAANVQNQIDSAVSGKGYTFSYDWNGTFGESTEGIYRIISGTLTMTADGMSAEIPFRYLLGTIEDSADADTVRAAAIGYISANGNNLTPAGLLAVVNTAISPSVATLESGDFFITHAVDGVFDEAADYPLSIPGHDGYVAAIFTVGGSRIGVSAVIPHSEENLGVLTTDVYSADSTVFTTDASGNITDYTGTAQKIVIPGSFNKGILFNNATGRANVQVVMIGAENDSVTTDGICLGNSCFSGWTNLRAMVLPYIMKSSDIGWRAVYNNPNLKYLRLPTSVQKSGGGYGVLQDGAFFNNPVLENAADKFGAMPSAQYKSSVFAYTAIRDIILPTWSQDLSHNSWNNPTYTTGVQTVLYQTSGVGSTTNYSPSIVMQNGTYTFARAVTLAQQTADGLAVTEENAAASAAAIVSTFSSYYSGECATEWSEDYSALTLVSDGARTEILCNRDRTDELLTLTVLAGAQMRLLDPTGLRFTAAVYGADALEAEPTVEEVRYGMLIAPLDYLDGIDFTADALDGAGLEYLDIPQVYWADQSQSNHREMSMVISNIRQENADRLFAARAYADITFANGNEKRIYSAFSEQDNARSVSYVAGRAVLDPNASFTADQTALLESYMRGGADSAALIRRTSILGAANVSTYTDINGTAYTGTTYYVSPNGSDSNNGTTPATAWKSISKIGGVSRGSKVLFERGGTYRGTFTAKNGVYYGAYGTGNKPVICGSWKNYATAGWTYTGPSYPGVYWTQVRNAFGVERLVRNKDAGIIVCDDGELVGNKKANLADVTAYGDFYYNYESGRLYIKTDADPSSLFSDIEIGLNDHIIIMSGSDRVTVENLALKYTGAFGISARDDVTDIKIRDCEIAYCGGSYSDGVSTDSAGNLVRYGNGIEFWGGCDNALVERCWIHEIFDSGISHQGRISDGNVFLVKDLTFKDNLIEKCAFAGIEYWVSDGKGSDNNYNRYQNILYSGNIIRFAGFGWGTKRIDAAYPGVGIYTPLYTNLVVSGSTFTVTGNTIDVCRSSLVSVITKQYGSIPVFTDNTLIHYTGSNLGAYGYFTSAPTANIAQPGNEAALASRFGTNPTIVIISQ